MHQDTRLALVALVIGAAITGLFVAVGRPLVVDIHLLTGITIGVTTFLALKHWGRRRTREHEPLREIRELAASTDYMADDPGSVPDDPAAVRPRQQAG